MSTSTSPTVRARPHVPPAGSPTVAVPADPTGARATVLSFPTSNYAGRPLGYRPADPDVLAAATRAAFAPVDTYPQRIGALVADVRRLGFDALDLWIRHLHPDWAEPEHVVAAVTALQTHGVAVSALTGWFGDTAEEVTAACRLARSLGTRLLSGDTGMLQRDRYTLLRLLDRFDVVLAVRNRAQPDPATLLRQVGSDGVDRIGVAADTGWFATQGYDPADAIGRLGSRLRHVRLADVRGPGRHEQVALGYGCVPVHRCVHALAEVRYTGPVSIGHRPADRDPGPGTAVSRDLVRIWQGTV